MNYREAESLAEKIGERPGYIVLEIFNCHQYQGEYDFAVDAEYTPVGYQATIYTEAGWYDFVETIEKPRGEENYASNS